MSEANSASSQPPPQSPPVPEATKPLEPKVEPFQVAQSPSTSAQSQEPVKETTTPEDLITTLGDPESAVDATKEEPKPTFVTAEPVDPKPEPKATSVTTEPVANTGPTVPESNPELVVVPKEEEPKASSVTAEPVVDTQTVASDPEPVGAAKEEEPKATSATTELVANTELTLAESGPVLVVSPKEEDPESTSVTANPVTKSDPEPVVSPNEEEPNATSVTAEPVVNTELTSVTFAESDPEPIVARKEEEPKPVANTQVTPTTIADSDPEPAFTAKGEERNPTCVTVKPVTDTQVTPITVADSDPDPVISSKEEEPKATSVTAEPVANTQTLVVESDPEPTVAAKEEEPKATAEWDPEAVAATTEEEPKPTSVTASPAVNAEPTPATLTESAKESEITRDITVGPVLLAQTTSQMITATMTAEPTAEKVDAPPTITEMTSEAKIEERPVVATTTVGDAHVTVAKRAEPISEKGTEEPHNELTKQFTEAEWEALKKFRDDLPNVFAEAFPDRKEVESTPINIWGVSIDPTGATKDARVSVVLMKFLRARNLNPTATREMLVGTLRWRESFNIEAALKEEFPQDVFGPLAHNFGVDKEGRPVVYNLYGANPDTKSVFSDVQRFIRWRVALQERSVLSLDFTEVDQMIQIHDYEGLSLSSRDANSKAAASEATNIFQNHYPELLYKKLFINVPTLLNWIFWMFKAIIPAATLAKMSVVGSGTYAIKKALLPLIDESNIPVRYGGAAEAF